MEKTEGGDDIISNPWKKVAAAESNVSRRAKGILASKTNSYPLVAFIRRIFRWQPPSSGLIYDIVARKREGEK